MYGLQLAKTATQESLISGNWDGYWLEPKLDGVRLAIDSGTLESWPRLYTRAHKDQVGKLPHLEKLLQSLPRGTVLDGEIVDVTEWTEIDGLEVPVVDFNSCVRVMGSKPPKAVAEQEERGRKLVFVAFDLIKYEGSEMVELDQLGRRQLLKNLVNETGSEFLKLSPAWEEWSSWHYQQLMGLECEGIMLKNSQAQYAPGKRLNKAWYKVKVSDTDDVVITGYTEGLGKFAGMIGAIQFSQYRDGELTYRGQCSGLTDEFRREVSDNQESFLGRVMEVKHYGVTGVDRIGFRHPQFLRMRDDKPAIECEWSSK